MRKDLADGVEQAIGRRPSAARALSGGCIAEVYRLDFESDAPLVAKVAAEGGLALEGFMLDYLARESALPVPRTVHTSDTLLLMEFVDETGARSVAAQRHAADVLAALHDIGAEAFGFERDTLIATLDQPNCWTPSWPAFYREQRVLPLARSCVEAGRLDRDTLAGLERLSARFEEHLADARPGLIHGDVWGGNVIYGEDRVAAFLDPAIYFADPEIELAFITLFSTFSDDFFSRYEESRPLRPGFWEERRELYLLYPLLVHTRLFGSPYDRSVARIVQRYT